MHSSWERAPRDAGLGTCGRGCFGATSFNSFQVSPNFPCPCVTAFTVLSTSPVKKQEKGSKGTEQRSSQGLNVVTATCRGCCQPGAPWGSQNQPLPSCDCHVHAAAAHMDCQELSPQPPSRQGELVLNKA